MVRRLAAGAAIAAGPVLCVVGLALAVTSGTAWAVGFTAGCLVVSLAITARTVRNVRTVRALRREMEAWR